MKKIEPMPDASRRTLLMVGAAWLAVPAATRAQQAAEATPSTASAPSSAAPKPLRVVASFSILADILRTIGGDDIDVHTLVGPDGDAHVYQPTPADARRVAEAQLVVVNGLGFEGWLDRLVSAAGYRGPVVVASAGIQPRQLDGAPDPHAWQDLRQAEQYVRTLEKALVQAAPASAARIQSRAEDYLAKLTALDAQVRRRFDGIAPAQRRVITSHDAFGYFGAAYGIEFLAPQGMSTDSDASAADVASLIRQIKSDRVKAVFVENISDPRLVERIAQDGGIKLGGRLYSDALSKPGTPGDTFLKAFAHNAQVLADAMVAP
ncbi:MAG: metal ABC transporter substrate-binding protein [Variovorax sp.]